MTTTTTRPVRVRVEGNLFHGRIPPGAVYVGRGKPGLPASPYANRHTAKGKTCKTCDVVHDLDQALTAYQQDLEAWTPQQHAQARRDLRGRDLACWCKPSDPCHADILLALVNDPKETTE